MSRDKNCRCQNVKSVFSPKFLRRYADLHTVMTDAIGQYVTDVKSGDFPNADERY